MKSTSIAILFVLIFMQTGIAQYYYRDLLLTGQTAEQLKKFRDHKIRSVRLASFENDDEPTEGFSGRQSIISNYTKIITTLASSINGESELTSIFNTDGWLIKTSDTTDGAGSLSDYTYNEKGLLKKILNKSTSGGQRTETEEHIWYYNAQGKPQKMFRIRNNTDTTFISFIEDENGNIAEEHARRNNNTLQTVFYYYDEMNRLTDVARYNNKAGRILPDYVFEYDENGLISDMMVIPEGSNDYQKWVYEYNQNGLKAMETCYNKLKRLMGKIKYAYE